MAGHRLHRDGLEPRQGNKVRRGRLGAWQAGNCPVCETDDVEGHGFRGNVAPEETDDDVEGHVAKSGR